MNGRSSIVSGWLTIFVFAGSGFALNATKDITHFVHTAWTEQQGAPENIESLAQTADGYLWIGTTTGVFHFDGVRFARFAPPAGETLPPERVRMLVATRDGGLWIVFWAGGVSRLLHGNVNSYSERDGLPSAFGLAERSDGALIAATASGLMQFQSGIWRDVGKEWNFPARQAKSVYFDRSGTLWVVADDRVVYLPSGHNKFEESDVVVPGLQSRYAFAQAPNGGVWLAQTSQSARLVRPARPDARGEPVTEVRVGASAVLFDLNGALWIGSIGDGLRRVASPETIRGRQIAQFGKEAEQYTSKQGLSGNYVTAMIEDREGNIWCGTYHGLDRFRDSPFTSVPIPDPDIPRFIWATRDGNLWAFSSSAGGTLRIGPGSEQELVYRYPMTSAYEDPKGMLWAADDTGPAFEANVPSNTARLFRLRKGRFVDVSLPKGSGITDIDGMTMDRAGGLWLLDERKGLFRRTDSRLTNIAQRTDLVYGWGTVFTDHLGRVWVGEESHAAFYDNGIRHDFGAKDGLPPGPIFAFHEDRAGSLWIGGGGGLSKFEKGRFRTLSAPNGFPATSVFGIAEDEDGVWWIASDTGVLRIAAQELVHAVADQAYRVRYESFNLLDGLPGKPRQTYPMPVVTRTRDGDIWFATSSGIAFVNPRRIPKNKVPPPVQIEVIRVDGKQVSPSDGMTFLHGTNDFEIDYTALSLSIPERVLFKYKLDGAETDWQDAGTRRQAFYNGLPPGPYRFHVIASNNDGLWNEEGAVLNFTVASAYYQTLWFRLLCVAVTLALLSLAYRIRVRQIAAGISARFDERLAERTRLARDLHDTLLQTIQGSKMVADDALKGGADPIRLKNAMERLSGWLSQAIEEGRTALNSLRSSTTEGNDLAEAFQRAGHECGLGRSIEFTLSVDGAGREMHPIVRDEIYRIGYEAIRNACLHSRASRLSVELSYLDNLKLCISDNGAGIDPDVAAKGKAGHFGLIGMYERASRIGGKLKLSSTPATGTQVELVVPRRIAFP